MRRLTLVSLFLFLLYGPIFLLGGQAFADCCMCGWGCYDGCNCPGTYGCAWCAVPDSQNPQAKAMASETKPNIEVVSEPLPSIAINANNVDRLIRRIGTGLKIGQCAQNTFRLQLTDGDRLLKLDEVFLKDNLMQANAVAFQIAKNGEK